MGAIMANQASGSLKNLPIMMTCTPNHNGTILDLKNQGFYANIPARIRQLKKGLKIHSFSKHKGMRKEQK
jgi:hypothetical protein